ncbi:MAG: transcriptional coactivator p15/PC4 family protein [Candidatus Bipolaricaulota bacterium]|nr:MAG: transcriptional coactivator p15/PC4 family protein [Candidatus Bipolaricaulota bacterium]
MAEETHQAEEQLIEAIEKGPGSSIHVRLSRLGDRDYLDIRNFFETEDGEWRPTRKGIAIPSDLVDVVLDALQRGRTALRGRSTASDS